MLDVEVPTDTTRVLQSPSNRRLRDRLSFSVWSEYPCYPTHTTPYPCTVQGGVDWDRKERGGVDAPTLGPLGVPLGGLG